MAKKQQQPTPPRWPVPPPPKNMAALYAGQLRNCIERGMNPKTLADLALAAQGPEFIYTSSIVTPAESFESFKSDPQCWQHLKHVEPKLLAFLEGFIARCKQIVVEQGIQPPRRPMTRPELDDSFRNAGEPAPPEEEPPQ